MTRFQQVILRGRLKRWLLIFMLLESLWSGMLLSPEAKCQQQPNATFRSTLVAAGFFPYVPHQDVLIARMKTLGFSRARVDLTWTDIERTPGRYDFSFYDALLSRMAAAGLNAPLLILDYNHPAYGPSGPPPTGAHQWGIVTPANRRAFVRFATAAARHYRGRGVLWEVWNEPDTNEFWAPMANPIAYTRLFQEVSATIHHIEPSARVFNGGLAHPLSKPGYVKTFIQANQCSGLKVLAIHGYEWAETPGITPLSLTGRNQACHGGKPETLAMADTELSLGLDRAAMLNPSNPSWEQARRVVQLLLAHYDDGFVLSAVYGLNDTPGVSNGGYNLMRDTPLTRALVFLKRSIGDRRGQRINLPNPRLRSLWFPAEAGDAKPSFLVLWSLSGRQWIRFKEASPILGIYNAAGERIVGPTRLVGYSVDASVGPFFIAVTKKPDLKNKL